MVNYDADCIFKNGLSFYRFHINWRSRGIYNKLYILRNDYAGDFLLAGELGILGIFEQTRMIYGHNEFYPLLFFGVAFP